MANKFYDLDQIRALPIKDVAATFGVKVNRGNMCCIRSEKTPSCKLYDNNKGGFDHFHDFGDGSHGDVIVFVSKIFGSEWQNALETLAETFGIEPVNNTEYLTRNELTDFQYLKIGIQGDLATKNLDFDLEKFSFESAQKYADKYKMTVNELRKQYPDFYTHKILMGKALPFVSEMKNIYYSTLYDHYLLAKALNVSNPSSLDGVALEKFNKLQKELELAERLLHKAARGTSLEETLPKQTYDVEKDYENIIKGNISFQVGAVSYHDLKNQARANDEMLFYRSVSYSDYVKLATNHLKNVPHAAFVKGEKVNLAFLPEHDLTIANSIDALKVEKNVERAVSRDAEKPKKNVTLDR